MYNPFRPHIVELVSGRFGVRKLTTSGWNLFDNQTRYPDNFWWSVPKYQLKYCYVDSLAEAQALLELSKVKVVPPSSVRKVYQ